MQLAWQIAVICKVDGPSDNATWADVRRFLPRSRARWPSLGQLHASTTSHCLSVCLSVCGGRHGSSGILSQECLKDRDQRGPVASEGADRPEGPTLSCHRSENPEFLARPETVDAPCKDAIFNCGRVAVLANILISAHSWTCASRAELRWQLLRPATWIGFDMVQRHGPPGAERPLMWKTWYQHPCTYMLQLCQELSECRKITGGWKYH